MYSRAQILFFDDPLAAVDNKVRAHLINRVLGPHGILKDKLRIVASNYSLLCGIVNESYDIREGKFWREEQSEIEISMVSGGSKKQVLSTGLAETEEVASPLAKLSETTLDSIITVPSASILSGTIDDSSALQVQTDLDAEATKGRIRRLTTIGDISHDRIGRSIYWR